MAENRIGYRKMHQENLPFILTKRNEYSKNNAVVPHPSCRILEK